MAEALTQPRKAATVVVFSCSPTPASSDKSSSVVIPIEPPWLTDSCVPDILISLKQFAAPFVFLRCRKRGFYRGFCSRRALSRLCSFAPTCKWWLGYFRATPISGHIPFQIGCNSVPFKVQSTSRWSCSGIPNHTHNFLDSQILSWLAYCARGWRCNWELGGQANLILSISCHSIVLDLLAQQLSGQLRISLRILWPLTSRGQEQMAASGRMAAAAFAFPRQRIYLCNWYVKLVKPGKELPDNHVQCHVPMKWVNTTSLAHDLMLFIISSFQEWRNLIFGITLRKSTESRLLKLTPGYSLVWSTAEWGHVITDSPHICALPLGGVKTPQISLSNRCFSQNCSGRECLQDSLS